MPAHATSSDSAVLARIVAEQPRWLAFLRSRGVQASDAEDLLQAALVKAFEKINTVRSEEDALAWFYRILRNTFADDYRKRSAEQKRLDSLAADMHARREDVVGPDSEMGVNLCRCFLSRLDDLNRRYSDLIRKIDLEGMSPTAVAEESKQASSTVHVALHRARGALRKELERFCQECATDGACLDCGCSEKSKDPV